MSGSSLSHTTCAANRSDGIKSAGFLATISPRVASTSGSKTKVIASSSKWFFERYGVPPSGAYKNSLSNTGEVISFFSTDNREVFNFSYSEFFNY